ncbi:MAG TPA: hypothetical protein VIJ92_08365 [Ginsengibacter sp.]
MNEENQISLSDKIINTANSIQQQPAEETVSQLTFLVNKLINEDFQALVQLLYRIDVNEEKLKTLLKKNQNVDAAPLIAELIITRQQQKISTKKHFDERRKSSSDDSW